MTKADIRNVTWAVTWFDGEVSKETVCTNLIDTADYPEPKEFAIEWCFDRLDAFRRDLGMANAIPKFKTFRFIRETKPSDLAL